MQIIKGILPTWHGNFIPLRDKNLNWSKVVDGTTSTQWKGLHEVSETVHSITLLMVGCKIAIPHPIQLLVLKVRKRIFTLYGTGWRKFRGEMQFVY
jgi:hypothetical protein